MGTSSTTSNLPIACSRSKAGGCHLAYERWPKTFVRPWALEPVPFCCVSLQNATHKGQRPYRHLVGWLSRPNPFVERREHATGLHTAFGFDHVEIVYVDTTLHSTSIKSQFNARWTPVLRFRIFSHTTPPGLFRRLFGPHDVTLRTCGDRQYWPCLDCVGRKRLRLKRLRRSHRSCGTCANPVDCPARWKLAASFYPRSHSRVWISVFVRHLPARGGGRCELSCVHPQGPHDLRICIGSGRRSRIHVWNTPWDCFKPLAPKQGTYVAVQAAVPRGS